MTHAGTLRGRLLIGGDWEDGARPPLDVHDKFTGDVIGTVDCAGRDQVEAAVAAALASFKSCQLDPQERYRRLQHVARLIDRHREELAALITAEGGLPIADAMAE